MDGWMDGWMDMDKKTTIIFNFLIIFANANNAGRISAEKVKKNTAYATFFGSYHASHM